MSILQLVILTIVVFAIVFGFGYLWFIKEPTEADMKYQIQSIRRMYAWKFARYENLSFDQYKALKQFEENEIKELKDRYRNCKWFKE